jgi:hypothetical protein
MSKLLWVKPIIGKDGRIYQVHYKVCINISTIERSFWFQILIVLEACREKEGQGCFGMTKVVVGEFYFVINIEN